MKVGPKSSLRPFLHRALQLYKLGDNTSYAFIKSKQEFSV